MHRIYQNIYNKKTKFLENAKRRQTRLRTILAIKRLTHIQRSFNPRQQNSKILLM